MEISKRRVGRPKASEQTGPLVLSERRARTKVEIEIPADVAEDFAKYVRWVEVSEGMSTTDARAATVEFALRNVFKRDRLWHEWRRKDERDDGGQASTPTPSRAAQPAAPSPSPPPPSGGRVPGNGTPAASR
jgi:hypothetical protein